MGVDTMTRKELDGVRYIFYLVGQALGVQDKYNLCHSDLPTTLAYMDLIFQNDIQGCLKTEVETERSRNMAQALLQGIYLLNPFLEPTSFHHWSFQLLECPLPAQHCKNQLSYTITKLVFHQLLSGKIGSAIRPLLNLLMKINIYLANRWRSYILQPKIRPFLYVAQWGNSPLLIQKYAGN